MDKQIKLWNLQDNARYWKHRFETSSPSEARSMQQKMISAYDLLKAFKRDNMPHLLEQPKITVPKTHSVPMHDWSEEFEQTLIK